MKNASEIISIMIKFSSIILSLSLCSFSRTIIENDLARMASEEVINQSVISSSWKRSLWFSLIMVFDAIQNYSLLAESFGQLCGLLGSLFIVLFVEWNTLQILHLIFKSKREREEFARKANKRVDTLMFISFLLPLLCIFFFE